jgi:hypothetical protein
VFRAWWRLTSRSEMSKEIGTTKVVKQKHAAKNATKKKAPAKKTSAKKVVRKSAKR